MTPIWDNLATNVRWRGVVCFIRNWVGPFDSEQGMAPEVLDETLSKKRLSLSVAVREWYLLSAKWKQGGMNEWISPQALEACDEFVLILTNTDGINHWGVRVADLDVEDPPVFSLEASPNEKDFPAFSHFVAAMIVNDVIFDYTTEEPVELNPGFVRANLACFVTARCGDFFADAPLEKATVVAFVYPGNGPAYGKSRTPAGQALLQRLCSRTT